MEGQGLDVSCSGGVERRVDFPSGTDELEEGDAFASGEDDGVCVVGGDGGYGVMEGVEAGEGIVEVDDVGLAEGCRVEEEDGVVCGDGEEMGDGVRGAGGQGEDVLMEGERHAG